MHDDPGFHSRVPVSHLVYDRRTLLSLYSPTLMPGPTVVERVRELGLRSVYRMRRVHDCLHLRRYRGRRSGRRARKSPIVRCAGNGAFVIVSARSPGSGPVQCRSPPVLHPVHIDRHSAPPGKTLVFGFINIRSLANKVDDLLETGRDLSLDVMFIAETWHDTESVCLDRLRSGGYQVVDRPRPRPAAAMDTIRTNHGGLAIVAPPGVCLKRLETGAKPTLFELLCVRVVSGSFSCVVVLIYRPPKVKKEAETDQTAMSGFFVELEDVLDRVVTFVDPLYIVGDINIHLERPDEPVSRQFVELLGSHGLACRVSSPTHDRGGMLDVVASREDLPAPMVDVVDIGLSDHRLLRWSTSLVRQPPVYTSVPRRPWRRLDMEAFRAGLRSSSLCSADTWSRLDVDGLARLYDTEITAVLDGLVPVATVAYRRRPSDPWFDDECAAAKREVRRLERAIQQDDPSIDGAATAEWHASRRGYRSLLRRKREEFWRTKIDAESSTPRQLWKSIDALMGRGSAPVSSTIGPTDFHQFFDAKVAGVRASTADAPSPTFTAVDPGCSFTHFELLTVEDVAAAIRALPDKQCSSDPIATRYVKEAVDVLAPFCTELFNRSLTAGSVPSSFKAAYVTPLLKKVGLDPADVSSYRPISNLSVMSKLLERLVAKQLVGYLTASGLLPRLQSAYRAHHSTETAVLRVMTDILRALDTGNLAVLTLLDLSAAFDTVDHATLLRRLSVTYGLDGAVLNWFRSYLSGRTQFVRCGSSKSASSTLSCGVPQGSVLGPILFLLYTADLLGIIEQHDLIPHLYADDTQICGYSPPSDVLQLQERVSGCVDDVAKWMQSNRLQLNTAKTEVLWCASIRRQHQIPQPGLRVGVDVIVPSASVRDLGIYLDCDVSMKTHVSKVVSSCFAVLRRLRSIRSSVTRPVFVSLVVSLVLSRLDYGNATLAGITDRLMDRLRSVLNASARLIYASRRTEHVTPLLRDLHWLRYPDRIDYKLAVLVYRCLQGLAPSYLADEFTRVSEIESRRNLRSASTANLVVPRFQRKTLGGRAFPVAAAQAWNSLPSHVTSSSSLASFKRNLKTELFLRSYVQS